ncbi:8079_t:CDS:2 [Funneliformis geosporum]|uniref:8079_t:CDS:1 n=1 Tax=Funneliformis geosporum TaxID=1117311 RepID=A0A9W4SXX2_9GLOM|nr:8079_t:CDS:2 [Funneliformis geosporum]
MEFINETTDIIRKYRKSEPGLLVTARATLLFVLVVLLGGYFAISTAWMVLDKGIIVSRLQPATIIPVPDVEISFNYHFNIACELRYLDGSPSKPCDEDLVTQPSCDENSEDKRWHGWFTSIDGRVKFNLTENLYGVWFTINIDDPRYQRDLDSGIVLGIPPSYFDEAYITSRYESVTAPDTVEFAGQPTIGPQKYANLFIGTLNWFEEVETESRTRRLLDSLGMLSGFYGLLVGIYILIFGFSPILPWGICQNFCMRRQIKSDLHEQYPKSIPLIEPPIERISLFYDYFVGKVEWWSVISGKAGNQTIVIFICQENG